MSLKPAKVLPTVRQLAADAGVNTMTVNKTYQLLKAEGFIEIDRRKGATYVLSVQPMPIIGKAEKELELLSAEASLKGMEKQEFLQLCEKIFRQMNPENAGGVSYD